MVVGVSGAEVHLSNGTSFVSAGSWTGAGSGSHRWYVGDFNGDGRDDLAGYQTGVGTLVHLSSGLSFNANTYWSTADTGGGTAFFVGDFNGDGRDDLGRRMSDGTFETMQSTGSSFSAPALLATRNLLPTYDLQVGDFDGDLSADVFFAQRVSNGGAVQALSNTPSYNGFTVSEMGRIVPFTVSRFHLSEVDSPIGAQAAAVDLTSITSLQALYTMAVTAFALQSSGPHFDAFSAPVDRVMFFAQWIGNLSLDTAAANLDQAASDQRNKATLLATFLEREGIASFVVTAGQATVNEVFVDGGWWSINAALGAALRGRWHDVIDTAVQPRGYVFDTAAMTAGAATYSPFVAQLHENFLLSSGTGVGFTFDRALAIDWIAAQAGGASVAGFVALPLETTADTAWSAPLHAGRRWFTGDFDGDGRTDLMSSAGSAGATIALSSGTSFANGVAWTAATSGNQGWYVGDFNGDHRTDIFAVVSGVSGAQMLLSTGSGFTSGGSWTGAGSGAQRWYVADFNGDGRDDVLRYVTGVSGAQVMLSDGTKFLAPVSWTGAGQGSIGRWFIGDYDGDGQDDLARVLNGSGFQVLSSTGTAFSGPVTWLSGVSSSNRLDVLDANGDGLDDVLVHGSTSQPNRLYLSTGTGFVASDWTTFTASTAPLLIGDFNGDGTKDAARFGHWSTPAQVHLTRAVDQADTLAANPTAADLFAVNDGFGRLIIDDFASTGALADRIDVGSTLATTYTAVAAAMQQVGLDVVIDFGDGDVLTLREVDIATITADLFIF